MRLVSCAALYCWVPAGASDADDAIRCTERPGRPAREGWPPVFLEGEKEDPDW